MDILVRRGESPLKILTEEERIKVRRFVDHADTMFFKIEEGEEKEGRTTKIVKKETVKNTGEK